MVRAHVDRTSDATGPNAAQKLAAAQEQDTTQESSATHKPAATQELACASEPTPAEVKREFSRLLTSDPNGDGELALHYLYAEGLSSGYIAPDEARTIRWDTPSPYGTLEISINRAKPEKDPRDIAAAASASRSSNTTSTANNTDAASIADGAAVPSPSTHAPLCDLCLENEGWPGSPGHPAKPHLRIANIPIGNETWGLQYSPYGYFQEHCIAIAPVHRPMKIDGPTIDRLLDFVDLFPHYFIGSNADLPIVGGSILSHDHFQGGRHRFALMNAPVETPVNIPGEPNVETGIVTWPASVLRVRSHDREALSRAARRILDAWLTYEDPACDIFNGSDVPADARTRGITPERHNSLNPIVYRDGADYICDLVLRNNATDHEHPWGIFHPDASLHHIKKENIGLIEIMGLAILPGRLEGDLTAGSLTREDIDEAFVKILEATGVFKRDEGGRAGWRRFLNTAGISET